MDDQAQRDQRELEAIQRQLADTRQHMGELEALIGDLPGIYERKFAQQLQPLLEQERLLLQQNLLLRDQLQRALPRTASRLQAPAPGKTPDGQGQVLGAGPLQPQAQPQPSQPPAPRAEAPRTEPDAPPRAPEPPTPGGQDHAAAAAGKAPGRWPPPYRLALGASVAALSAFAFGLGHRQLAPCRTPGSPAPLGAPKPAPQPAAPVPRQAPAIAGPIPAAAPGSPAAGAGPARAQELLVVARGPSWIELRDSQGRTVYGGLLEGRQRFRLGAGLSLKAGRPELVQVRLGAGPAQALPPGEWWTWHRFKPPGA